MSDRFFSSDSFMPHGHCYLWRPDILWLNVAGDALIALAYFSIPLALIYFVRKRRDLAFSWIFVMFAMFIVSCGATHLFGIWAVWNPDYGVQGLLKMFTAGVSIATALALWPLMPKALALPSPEQLRTEIEHRKVAQLELAERNRRLIEAEKAKSQFLASVSHELRTPLTLILAPLESLLGDHSAPLSPQMGKALTTMHNNSQRLLQMINGLLDFSKLEAGKVDFRPEATDASALVAVTIEDFQPLAEEAGVKLTGASVIDSSLYLLLDRYIVERILFNLVSNALKFTPRGGRVSVKARYHEEHCIFEVEDTGIGIAETAIPTLFEKFHQVEGALTRRFHGTGLGLALVKEFAEQHGGTVEVESVVGKGAKFTVSIPAKRSGDEAIRQVRGPKPVFSKFVNAKEQSAVKTLGQENLLGMPRALIVEDNNELANYVAQTLEGFCQTRIAKDGVEGLQVFEEWRPDVVISDVMMPNMDGLELCHRIKSEPTTALTPVLLLTALTHREMIITGFEAGADDYIPKPFHPRELQARVRSVLNAINAREEAKATLMSYNLRLKEEVRQRTSELELAKNAAEAASQAKSAFLANMSHEIRTPLGAVVGFSEIIATCEVTPSERVSYVAAIKRNSELLANIINDILDISKVEVGKLEVERTDVHLNEILSDVTSLLNLKAVEKGILFSVTADGVLPEKVCTDALRLRQILFNIVGNAIKFTDEGSVELRVKQVMDGEGRVVMAFEVTDTGHGISEGAAAELFLPFTQLDARLTRKHGGAGLGLALSKHLANLLGGDVELTRSEPGMGSQFVITIDPGKSRRILFQGVAGGRSMDVQQRLQLVRDPVEKTLTGLRVLVAEDSPDNQALVKAHLTLSGVARIDIAHNGVDAVRMALENEYDIVLMDLQMPEKDGYSATAELRGQGYDRPIVALTAHAMGDEIKRCLTSGFDAHVSKPMERRTLIKTIEGLVREV